MLNFILLSLETYKIESWVLLGLLAIFIIIYGYKTFKRHLNNVMTDDNQTNKSFIVKDPFNDLSKSHLKLKSSEVPIEKAHVYTKAKATKMNMPSQKIKSKVNIKVALQKLREIKKK